MFEGATGEDNRVDFLGYEGESQLQHSRGPLYEAVLLDPSSISAEDIKDGSNQQVRNQFMQFMKQMNRKCQFPKIKLNVRFGKIYCFKKHPDVSTLAELSKLELESDFKLVPKSAFQPLHMPHEAMKGFLNKEGYQPTSTDIVFGFCMKKKDGVSRVILNEDLEVVEVKSQAQKLFTFNIKRIDPKRRDYRFILSEEKVISPDDPNIENYQGKEMIRKEGEDDFFVTPEFINGFEMLRQKTRTKFRNLDDKAEVSLERVKEYMKPNQEGRFTAVKPWREELVIKYEVPENWRSHTSFIQEVMKFSYRLEEVAPEVSGSTD